jgi:ribosomal-protein-alanine N-acetyltransferase
VTPATLVLTTDRLELRPVTHGDHARLLDHWTLPEVRQFMLDGAVMSAAEVTGVIDESTATFQDAGYGLWLVSPRHGGELVGTAGLRPLDDLGLEIIYSLAPAAWGNGYATEAAGAVLDYALGPLALPEVLAEIDEGNAASAAVARRLGMTAFDTVPGLLGPMTRYRRTRSAPLPDSAA